MVAHPHQAVDGYALLAAAEGRVEQAGASAKVEQGRLKPEEHGGIGAQGLGVELAALLQAVAEVAQHLGIVRNGIAAQVGQRRTLANAPPAAVGDGDEPHATLGVNAARRARRLAEMEQALVDGDL